MILYCDQPGCDYHVDEATIGDSPRSAPMRLNNHRRQKHDLGPVEAAPPPQERDPMDDSAEADGPYAPPAPQRVPELPTGEVPPSSGGARSAGVEPVARRRGFSDWLKGKGKTRPSADPRPTKEKPPRPPKPARGRRLSGAELLADAWGFGGGQLQRIGHLPTGRMVRFQAPIAGELLDDVIAGTLVDRAALQKIIGAKGKLDMLYAIAGPPALVWQLEKAMAAGNADAVDMLEGMLKGAIKDGLPLMIPAMKKARAREAKANAEMAELLDGEDLAALGVFIGPDGQPTDADGHKVDVADVFVSMLFAEWTPPAQPVSQPEETAHHDG